MVSQDLTLPLPIQFKMEGICAMGKLMYYKKNKSICFIEDIQSTTGVSIPEHIANMKGKYYSSIGGAAKTFKQVSYDVNGWIEAGFSIFIDKEWKRFAKGENTSVVTDRFKNTIDPNELKDVIVVASANRGKKRKETSADAASTNSDKKQKQDTSSNSAVATESIKKEENEQEDDVVVVSPVVYLSEPKNESDPVEKSLSNMLNYHRELKEKIVDLELQLAQHKKQLSEYKQLAESQKQIIDAIRNIIK